MMEKTDHFIRDARNWKNKRLLYLSCEQSGAGAENGAERARKPDERERDSKNYCGAEREFA